MERHTLESIIAWVVVVSKESGFGLRRIYHLQVATKANGNTTSFARKTSGEG